VGGGAHTRVPTIEWGIVLCVKTTVKMKKLAQASVNFDPGWLISKIDHPNRGD
jgi:hypothetical protein